MPTSVTGRVESPPPTCMYNSAGTAAVGDMPTIASPAAAAICAMWASASGAPSMLWHLQHEVAQHAVHLAPASSA